MLPTKLTARAASDSSSDRLPVSHTCFFTVDVPSYPSFELLKAKFDMCLDMLDDMGFGLS